MGFKVSVAGGLELDMIPFFRGVDISVFIIGRAIRETTDPVASARRFRALINQYWGGGGANGHSNADQAAKAVRWGISEMGLLLTVDGRDCPGCDAPGRFCHGTRTEIQVPAGIDSQALVKQIAASLDMAGGEAVGWTQPGIFYLDVSGLSRLNEPDVIGLLAITGQALNALGHGVETGTALNVAQSILNEYR